MHISACTNVCLFIVIFVRLLDFGFKTQFYKYIYIFSYFFIDIYIFFYFKLTFEKIVYLTKSHKNEFYFFYINKLLFECSFQKCIYYWGCNLKNVLSTHIYLLIIFVVFCQRQLRASANLTKSHTNFLNYFCTNKILFKCSF